MGNADSVRTRTVQVEHIEVSSKRPFAEVIRRLEAETGFLDLAEVTRRIASGEPAGALIDALAAMAGRSGLMRFVALDHGAILRLQGRPAQAIRYLIGHPLIAAEMTSRRLASGLYAPLSVLVCGDGRGTTIEYDQPSSLVGALGDPEVTRIGRDLDEKLAKLVRSVAE